MYTANFLMSSTSKKEGVVLARLAKVYSNFRLSGISVKPKPGKSGAITRYLGARRCMSFTYWCDEDGKPWSRRTTGADFGPASRKKTLIPLGRVAYILVWACIL